MALTMMGVINVRHGRLEGNRELIDEGLSGAIAVGDGHLAVIAEMNMAAYLLDQGDIDAAATLLASSVLRQRSIRLVYSMLFLLHGAASVARAHGNERLASLLLGAASQQRRSIGASGRGNQAGRNRLIEDLRTTLTPQGFAEALEKGATLSYADALDSAARATETQNLRRPRPRSSVAWLRPTRTKRSKRHA